MATENQLIISTAAREDMQDAYDWYEEKSEGLGERFLENVESTLSSIQQNPEMFAVRGNDQRAAMVKSFPYLIIYALARPVINILRVFHTSRDPSSI